jgi:uncharacterized protein YutE (UPF0331/DUF86 family)
MRELLDDLGSAAPDFAAVLIDDRLRRHAIERILTQLVEMAVKINSHVVGATLGRVPRSYKESFSLAVECGLIDRELADELEPSAGMRNVLVHEYLEIDVEKVAAAVPLALDGYRRYVSAVARFVTGG